MPQFASDRPLRVAVVGAGPAGFYAAEALLKSEQPKTEVDMFDRLPTPFGLVRSGVAPDHPKIKSVTRVFEKIADHPGFRFFGNVCIAEAAAGASSMPGHVSVDDLRAHYDAVVFTTGAQTDRSLGIPGEDLAGSHSATEFVAWYNGHPEFRDRQFDLSTERAVVVGVGNVAVDVARVLCRTMDELRETDIADYALDALAESRVSEVVMLGRRGPAQAAFTLPEVKELGEMAGADIMTLADEVKLDGASRTALESADRSLQKTVELVQEYAGRPASGKPKRIALRFLVSPVEIVGDDAGRVRAVRIVRNRLVDDGRGGLRAEPTGVEEEIEAGLVFRSVGYRGVPLAGVPFDEKRAVVPNDAGRVLDLAGEQAPGLYVAGWIKRGPTGVIGTNKGDAHETAEALLSDAAAGLVPAAPEWSPEAAEAMVRDRQPDVFDYADWRRLDAHEVALGAAAGRPRVKLCGIDEMRDVLKQPATPTPSATRSTSAGSPPGAAARPAAVPARPPGVPARPPGGPARPPGMPPRRPPS